MESQDWKMKNIGRKVSKIILAIIVVIVLSFAIKEVRDLLTTWAINYPTIREIALYCLSAVLVITISLIGLIIYHFSK